MKTKDEMIYDFMVALASNPNPHKLLPLDEQKYDQEPHEAIYIIASQLTQVYLENLV